MVPLQLAEDTAHDVRDLVTDLRDALASLQATIQQTRFIGKSMKPAPALTSEDVFSESPTR
jgi:hypothetical protein